jgi:hypothetical protein
VNTLHIPDDVCIIELLGRQRIRGKVRVLWLGPIPFFQVTSAEPHDAGMVHGPFGHGAVYAIRAMTGDDHERLAEDIAYYQRCQEERRQREREEAAEHEQVVADAPKYAHLVYRDDDKNTVCGVPTDGLRRGERAIGFDCPHCHALDAEIPY